MNSIQLIVLNQHAKLYFFSAILLKQLFVGRHVAPLRQTILILKPTSICSYFLMMHA